MAMTTRQRAKLSRGIQYAVLVVVSRPRVR